MLIIFFFILFFVILLTGSEVYTILSYSRHCEYIPIHDNYVNNASCIDGKEASRYTSSKPYREKPTPDDIPKVYDARIQFEGSMCFCNDRDFCNDVDLVYNGGRSTMLACSIWMLTFITVVRTLLIGL